MKIAIARIIKRQICRSAEEQEIVNAANQREIEDAKEWCRKSIELRARRDNLDVNRDDIIYTIKEGKTQVWDPPFAYKVTELEKRHGSDKPIVNVDFTKYTTD